jgi:hypothetical protein
VTDDDDRIPKTYAGELRAMGLGIPEGIPDCAWVPAASIQWVMDGIPESQPDGRFTIQASATFTEAFQWVRVSGTIEP